MTEKKKTSTNPIKDRLDEEDLTWDTSDTSKYVDNNVKEDNCVDNDVNNDVKEDNDNKESIDPDIDKVGGWVYGKEYAFFPT